MRFSYKEQIGYIYNFKSLWVDMVEREEFDDFLARKAVEQGVIFKDNEAVLDFNEFDDRVEVITDKNKSKCLYLAGADGVYSNIAKKFGFKVNKNFLMLETKLFFSAYAVKEDFDTILCDIGAVKNGVAWIFPKGDYALVGVYSDLLKGQELRERLDYFIDIHKDKFNIKDLKYKGIVVPFYRSTKNKLASKRVLLVGDAARLMNPITGEGLSIAARSANIAADFISKANGSLKDYDRLIRKSMYFNLAFSYWFSRVFNLCPYFFYKIFFAKGPSILNYFLDPLRKLIR